MKYSGIILPKKSNPLAKVNGFIDVEIENYMPIARKLLSEAGNEKYGQVKAIHEICSQIVRYDPLISASFIDILAKDFKIKKEMFHSAMKEAKRKIKAENKVGYDDTPLINRAEKYIQERYDIYYNVVANKFMFKRKMESNYTELNLDVIYCDLKKHHINFSMSDLRSLMKSNFVPKRNEIEEYFMSLKWDGIDYIGLLAEYIEVEEISSHSHEKERFRRMFRKTLVRMVACAFQTHVNKQCFTLVHAKQNSGKSTFFRWLPPPALKHYYTENIGTSKDDLIALTENFIINLDELSSLSKYDINALKNVMSRDTVKVRLPYGERPVMLQRRCSFVASTNRLEFLNDETGSVRWICFLLKSINWKYKDEIDINQVWAQAYYLYQSKEFDFQLSASEIEENEEANKSFLIRTPEMELIQMYLIPRTQDDFIAQGNTGSIRFMTSTEILAFLQVKSNGCVRLSSVNVGKSLTILGFIRGSMYNKNGHMSIKGYYVEEKCDAYQASLDSLNMKADEMRNDPQTDLPY